VNVLLEGPDTAIEVVVQRLLPHLREPVVSIQPGAAFSLPGMEIGTLVLNQVATLTIQQQMHLLEWSNTASPRPQLVSTSREPLYPRVERALFAEALYYRLNVIRIQVDSSSIGPYTAPRRLEKQILDECRVRRRICAIL
jgi:hypothetical protein